MHTSTPYKHVCDYADEYSGPSLHIWVALNPHCQTWIQQYSACCLWMSSACCHPSLLHSARSGLCLSHCCLWPTCRRKICLWCLTVWSPPAYFSHSLNLMPSLSHRPDPAPTPSTMEARCKFNASRIKLQLTHLNLKHPEVITLNQGRRFYLLPCFWQWWHYCCCGPLSRGPRHQLLQ